MRAISKEGGQTIPKREKLEGPGVGLGGLAHGRCLNREKFWLDRDVSLLPLEILKSRNT